MKVVVYLPKYNDKHCSILTALSEGIPGAILKPLDEEEYEPSDVAVIFGLWKRSYPATNPKRKILALHHGRSLLVVESSFVRRGEYWNVGWGGINGGADFRTEGGMSLDRWWALEVHSKPWCKKKGYVIVCGQVPWDTNVQDIDHAAWCRETIEYFLDSGERVMFRPHPRITDLRQYYPGIDEGLIDQRPLKDALNIAKCLVTWNSNSGVDAAIKGTPVIACDPSSGAWDVSSHSVESIKKLSFPSRYEWLAALGYSQWSIDEMRRGLTWQHLTRKSGG